MSVYYGELALTLVFHNSRFTDLTKKEEKLKVLGPLDEKLRRLEESIKVFGQFKQYEEQLKQKEAELQSVLKINRQELENTRNSYELQVQTKDLRIAELLNTLSWKITRPLRAVYDILRWQKKDGN